MEQNKKETNPFKPLQESEKINLRNDSILELNYYCWQLELYILNESGFVSQVNLGPNWPIADSLSWWNYFQPIGELQQDRYSESF